MLVSESSIPRTIFIRSCPPSSHDTYGRCVSFPFLSHILVFFLFLCFFDVLAAISKGKGRGDGPLPSQKLFSSSSGKGFQRPSDADIIDPPRQSGAKTATQRYRPVPYDIDEVGIDTIDKRGEWRWQSSAVEGIAHFPAYADARFLAGSSMSAAGARPAAPPKKTDRRKSGTSRALLVDRALGQGGCRVDYLPAAHEHQGRASAGPMLPLILSENVLRDVDRCLFLAGRGDLLEGCSASGPASGVKTIFSRPELQLLRRFTFRNLTSWDLGLRVESSSENCPQSSTVASKASSAQQDEKEQDRVGADDALQQTVAQANTEELVPVSESFPRSLTEAMLSRDGARSRLTDCE